MFLLPGSVGILMRPPPHSPRARIRFLWFVYKRNEVIRYLGVLKELVGRELAGREQRLTDGGYGMRCGAVAC